MMDALADDQVSDVTYMTSSQIGKTEIFNNAIGYFVDIDPCPMMMVQPTIEMARAWSKDRLDPMIRDNPSLRKKIGAEKEKSKDNTILHKRFKGGHITVAGANSPASLASRPIRVALCDEIDRYPLNIGKEGDPTNLAFKRTRTFFNKKRLRASTPTIEGISRIATSYESSDMRKFWVPCHHCGEYQVLVFKQIVCLEEKNPETAHYRCEHCDGLWNENDKRVAVTRGEWRAEKPFNGHAGFHIWEAYSPWSTMAEIMQSFFESKESPETLQTFVNTTLGETWQQGGGVLDSDALFSRRETYTAVPNSVLVLVAGVDVQADRLEYEVVGYGRGEESWGIEFGVIWGDTELDSTWQSLTDELTKGFVRQDGVRLKVVATAVDSGYRTQTVYGWCLRNRKHRWHAVKGTDTLGTPAVMAPSKKKTAWEGVTIDVFMIGTHEAKTTIYNRLQTEQPGERYCHWSESYDLEYFEQLTSERKVREYVKGFARDTWIKKPGVRNEALDIRVYALVALLILNPVWSAIEKRLQSQPIAQEQSEDRREQSASRVARRPKRKRRSGFVGGFR
jgi:phage terminase large subunit GpA-like protein